MITKEQIRVFRSMLDSIEAAEAARSQRRSDAIRALDHEAREAYMREASAQKEAAELHNAHLVRLMSEVLTRG